MEQVRDRAAAVAVLLLLPTMGNGQPDTIRGMCTLKRVRAGNREGNERRSGQGPLFDM